MANEKKKTSIQVNAGKRLTAKPSSKYMDDKEALAIFSEQYKKYKDCFDYLKDK